MSAKLLIGFFAGVKMQIISKIFFAILEVKITNKSLLIQFVPQNDYFGEKWRFWPPKWSKSLLKLIASSRHRKTIPLTLTTPLLPLIIAYLQRSSLIVHLPIGPQFLNFCVFHILFPEFDLTITSIPQYHQSPFTTHF